MRSLVINILIIVFVASFGLTLVFARDDIDRTKRPIGKSAPKIHLPNIQKATLKNGLQVWLVEHHELPTVAFNLVVQAGSDHDPVGQPGIASMTADLMDEGTTIRDALQISDELGSIGAMLNVSSSYDGSFLTLNTLTKYLDKALAIYVDVLTHPTFPKKDFERIKNQRITTLIQQRDQPTVIANNAYSLILYGANHPYGNNPVGTELSLKAMTRESLQKFYETFYRPNNATLIVVGDVILEVLVSKLDGALTEWQSNAVPSYSIPQPKTIDQKRVYLIDKSGAPQSEIRIGYPALARSTPDYFPVLVMNRMLGGQFTSRINLNLRERHGFTYGARSAFNFQKGAGPFTASAGVMTEKTDSALHEFLYEINLMKEKGMTADELVYTKKGLTGNFALTFETPAQIAGALQNIVLFGLPENYFENYLQLIEAVSLEDVQRVANKYLDTSKMDIVVVGDVSKTKDGISSMKIGDIILCDVDGNPLP
jgi:zinc protease